VEDEEICERAKRKCSIKARIRTSRDHCLRHWQPLVVSLIRCRTTLQELLGRIVMLRNRVRVVVVDFVVVAREDPWEQAMSFSEMRIGTIQRIACPIALESLRFLGRHSSRASAAALVYVITEKDDQVEVLARHVVVRGVKTVLKILARGESKPQTI